MQSGGFFQKRRLFLCAVGIAVSLLFLIAYNYVRRENENGKSAFDASCVTQEERAIRGNSMFLSFKDGGKAKTFSGYFECNPVKEGQLVVLAFKTREEEFVKRIAAQPGDTLVFEGENGTVNGAVLKNPDGQEYKFSEQSKKFLTIPLMEGKIPEGRWMALSDEVGPSAFDSRQYGFVEREHLKGLVIQNKK